MENTFSLKYRDFLWMPPLLVFMRSFDILIVYPHLLFSYRFFRTLFEDTLVTAICWLAMRSFILWLDKVHPYQKGIVKRIALQIPLALLLNCGLLLLINEGVQYFYYQKPTPQIVFTHHIWIYGMWTLLQNAIYMGIYLLAWFRFLELQNKNTAATPTPNLSQQKLTIKLGNKNIYLDFSKISFCAVADNFTSIYTQEDEFFLIEKSLDQLSNILPPGDFFRANRQYIIHKNLVKAVEKQEQGKLKLLLKHQPHLPLSIAISRLKAPSLKKWLQQQSA